MRQYLEGLEVADGQSSIAQDRTIVSSRHKPDGLGCATEIGAVKDRRDPGVTRTTKVAHAGETIDDHFWIVDPSRCRLDECERGGCDDPVNGLHDYPLLREATPPPSHHLMRRCGEKSRTG